jgi:hypothetical protein
MYYALLLHARVPRFCEGDGLFEWENCISEEHVNAAAVYLETPSLGRCSRSVVAKLWTPWTGAEKRWQMHFRGTCQEALLRMTRSPELHPDTWPEMPDCLAIIEQQIRELVWCYFPDVQFGYLQASKIANDVSAHSDPYSMGDVIVTVGIRGCADIHFLAADKRTTIRLNPCSAYGIAGYVC